MLCVGRCGSAILAVRVLWVVVLLFSDVVWNDVADDAQVCIVCGVSGIEGPSSLRDGVMYRTNLQLTSAWVVAGLTLI
jgi:hypothetical protein